MPRVAELGALLDQLVGLTWPARTAVHGGIAGTHASRLRGLATEFTEYRPYRQGDDPRRLDWKLLARTDRAFLRISNDRATFTTLLVLDGSASMAFPPGIASKWDQACRVAVGLAAVARAAGDPVGLVAVTGDRVVRVPPRTRRGVLGEMAGSLQGVHPGGSVSLAPTLAGLRRASRLVVLSDFLDDEDAVIRSIREHVAAGAEVHGVQVLAGEELDPARRAFLATDPERPSLRRALVDRTREGYLAALEAWRRTLAAGWRAAGGVWHEVVTREPAARVVRRIVSSGS